MTDTGQDQEPPSHEREEPLLSLTLWPHRSLDPRNLRWIMIAATIALAVPLFPVLGSKALYVLGFFAIADLALLYAMMRLTYRSGRVRETVRLWPDRLRIERFEPNGARKSWEANPHWVRIELLETKQIKDYLVLSASGREVELGAFLTPEERRSLADRLRQGLIDARRAAFSPATPPSRG